MDQVNCSISWADSVYFLFTPPPFPLASGCSGDCFTTLALLLSYWLFHRLLRYCLFRRLLRYWLFRRLLRYCLFRIDCFASGCSVDCFATLSLYCILQTENGTIAFTELSAFVYQKVVGYQNGVPILTSLAWIHIV